MFKYLWIIAGSRLSINALPKLFVVIIFALAPVNEIDLTPSLFKAIERSEVETSWDVRVRPITYMTPLQDAYTEVADENDEVIYILANSGKLIPATFWKSRPLVE